MDISWHFYKHRARIFVYISLPFLIAAVVTTYVITVLTNSFDKQIITGTGFYVSIDDFSSDKTGQGYRIKLNDDENLYLISSDVVGFADIEGIKQSAKEGDEIKFYIRTKPGEWFYRIYGIEINGVNYMDFDDFKANRSFKNGIGYALAGLSFGIFVTLLVFYFIYNVKSAKAKAAERAGGAFF